MLAKNKLNSIEVLISRFLINSSFSHDEFALVNNVLKENNIVKEETKNLKTSTVHQRFLFICKACYRIVWNVENRQIVKAQGFQRQIKEK